LSRQVLNISREGDSTASLGSLFQGSVTLRVKLLKVKILEKETKQKSMKKAKQYPVLIQLKYYFS